MKDLLSVIVPIYNVELYLKRCVDSILNQIYPEMEIILVDDGSTDSCGKICDNYQRKDKRIKVIHKKNGGLSSARNYGLDIAIGEYIAFIDSDDYIDENMFSDMIAAMKRESSDMSICNIQYVYEHETHKTPVPSPVKNEVLTPLEVFEKFTDNSYYYYITACNKIYRKELWDNIRFPDGKLHEDEFVAHHIIQKCNKICTLQNRYYYYFQRESSIMNSKKYDFRHVDVVDAFIDRYGCFETLGLHDSARYALLGAYNSIINCIRQTEVRYHKKEIKRHVKDVCRGLRFDLRAVKLKYVYYKKRLRELASFFMYFLPIKIKMATTKNDKRFIMLSTPTHGNLGDHAIAYAESQIIKKLYPNYKIVEISNYVYLKFKNESEKLIKEKDTIIVDGGGNLGTLWPWEDDKISGIIDKFRNNKIVVFPQTIHYDNDEYSRARIEKNKKIYNQAKDLTIFLRDEKSYDFFTSNFGGVNILLCPDVVLSLNERKEYDRKDILLCFRKDLEKVIDDEQVNRIKEFLKGKNLTYFYTDTVIPKCITKNRRKIELKRKWTEFSHAKLIITDRLHCMIFAFITETPCIAINNRSKKVEGTYEFIKNCSYIKLAQDVEDVLEFIPTLLKENIEYNNNFVYPYDIIKEVLGNGKSK